MRRFGLTADSLALHLAFSGVFALGTGMVAGCGHSDEEMNSQLARVAELEGQLADAQRQRDDLDTRLGSMQEQNEQLIARLEALGQDVESLRSERTSLGTQLTETQRALEELRERERQQQARLATFRQMLERFRAMIDSGRLRVRVVRNRMVVELPDNVLFDSGEAELRDEGEATLAEVARVLVSIEGRQFQVCGHTDSVPIRSRRFASNWELSTARAVSVSRYLLTQGLPADRISAAGYAETQPVDTNDTAEGRAHNRRIEIALVPNIDELPDLSSITE